jgi:hypothetical protein
LLALCGTKSENGPGTERVLISSIFQHPELGNLRSEKEDLHKQLLEKEAKEREQEDKIRQLRSMILTTPGPLDMAKKKMKSMVSNKCDFVLSQSQE